MEGDAGDAADQVMDRPRQHTDRGSGWQTLPLVVLGLMVWVAIGMGIAAAFSASARTFWFERWPLFLYAAILVLGLLGLGRIADSWEKAYRQRVAAIVVICGLTVGLMGIIALGSTSHYTLAAQLILIPVTSLLPALIYFLFLATRRPSILNEFIGNIGRLGLLRRRTGTELRADGVGPHGDGVGGNSDESDSEQRARVEGYFQRFEAIYGSLRFGAGAAARSRQDLVVQLIRHANGQVAAGHDALVMPEANVEIADLFHANLIIPIGLVTLLTTLGWLLVLQPNLHAPPAELTDLMPKLSAVNFAFLGAYFFGIQMLFRRFVRRDLGPNAYFAFALRIILSTISVWLVVATLDTAPSMPVVAAETNASAAEGMMGKAAAAIQTTTSAQLDAAIMVIAFTIGVFPRVIWQYLSAVATRVFRVKVVMPSVEADQPLHQLDGLTVWHESRLEEEDIENVPNMASADIVELMLHTQIPIERLVGWIDQAILLTALGAKVSHSADPAAGALVTALRGLGLRTASQVVVASNDNLAREELERRLGGGAVLAVLVSGLRNEGNFTPVWAWRRQV